jgi:hypothetical protein
MFDNKRAVQEHDIKRILIERDIAKLKQTFCRIICAEIRNNHTRALVPDKIFSKDQLHNILRGKELGFEHQVLQSQDYSFYNGIIELVIRELVSGGIITKQQQQNESASDEEQHERYEATENLDKMCNDFRDSGLLY